MYVGESVESRGRGALEKEGRQGPRAKKATGAGKQGSLRGWWKLLAGMVDGFDNGWPLIRADAW